MKISLKWLKRYVDIDVPVQELCDKMVMSGFEVEDIEDLSETMQNVVSPPERKMPITAMNAILRRTAVAA